VSNRYDWIPDVCALASIRNQKYSTPERCITKRSCQRNIMITVLTAESHLYSEGLRSWYTSSRGRPVWGSDWRSTNVPSWLSDGRFLPIYMHPTLLHVARNIASNDQIT
jgi:hypothetical protein